MHFRALALLLLAGSALNAQTPELKYVPELTIDLAKENIRRPGLLTVGPRGRMVLSTGDFYGELIAFDSSGKKLPWSVPTGFRARDAEIGWVSRMGWTGDSVWVADDGFNQVAIVDTAGRVVRSVERPSWVRPFWRDRRRYPLFAGMEWEAVYGDSAMLVVPKGPRAIFDTPLYDRSMVHLLRVSRDGKILQTVARIPAEGGALQLRDGTRRSTINIPFFAPTRWKTSADGRRIVIVRPLMSASDSGAFVVTMLTDKGDTVFSRRHRTEAKRVPSEEVEKRLARIDSVGRRSAEWIRDTIRKQVPAFDARIANVILGVDYSTWVWVRTDSAEQRALVIDARGEMAGVAVFPIGVRQTVYSIDRLWRLERAGPIRANPTYALVRLKRAAPATDARRARSAPASASPRPGRSP